MRHELLNLLGAFSEPGAPAAGPSFGAPFVIVATILALGTLVCVARVLLG
ncbi:hypothetical protein [Mesorhizobium sp. P5_C1]